jgi:hypothetical protein
MTLAFSSASFRFCDTKRRTKTQPKTLIIRSLNHYNRRIEHNHQKLITLQKELYQACDLKVHFSSQKECKELYLEIEDISEENRRLNLLKREIFLQNGIEWDEEYN